MTPTNENSLLDLLATALFETFIEEIEGVKPKPHVEVPIQGMADRALQQQAKG